jgi:hypothetical protein
MDAALVISSAANNKFNVSAHIWRSWPPTARKVFNNVYSIMCESQWMFLHPGTKELPGRAWRTTAWNAAWVAAEAVRNNEET